MKKEYQNPQISVMNLCMETSILAGVSSQDGIEVIKYNQGSTPISGD